MRGGHLDYSVLGAYETSESGDLANWSTGDAAALPGIGGAMDLAVGARSIWVIMEHTTKEGNPRIVTDCRLPLTAPRVVKRIFTNLAVIDVTPWGLQICEMVEGMTVAKLQGVTGARLVAAGQIALLTA